MGVEPYATLFFGYARKRFDPRCLFDDGKLPAEFEWLDEDDVDEEAIERYLIQRYEAAVKKEARSRGRRIRSNDVVDWLTREAEYSEDGCEVYATNTNVTAYYDESQRVDRHKLATTPKQIEAVKSLAQKLGFDTQTEEPDWHLVAGWA